MTDEGGWVYLSPAEIEDAAKCDCELCDRITQEGVEKEKND